ncbi:MAG: HsdR family type I site-specific deoxyribonuclease [Verrucomicrobia bacterium]|nr:HsdR family type I site-specific deoxyribonuclease [Verrucomicrobiota bacterium]OQC68048.1 MAG: Type I restriction enzyme EcoR124II R protein [Verrucomicrobia bacterium ADurb.Bin006]MDI9381638.1 HsdR family type I site-specific deoxyribonuclease [Verrucomicrobiota bacterium]HOA61015.1 HsdR family type I site-specific deoxyribonuclease [Verrucomicrobiota bacterium]HOF47947.1 HsdR family type I site-specific deoxyribonuclease [Verrucomicrobiota bacterium]
MAEGQGKGAQRREREDEAHYRGGFQFSGLVERARELRKTNTPAEEVLWELLRSRRFLGLKFRRQHQIGDYLTDFYCQEAKLVVETDGGVHDLVAVQKKDHKRDAYLKSLGLEVIRFRNALVLEQPEEVLKRLADALPSPTGRGAGGEGKTHSRLGVFWQTQGAGKSYSMVFFAQKVLRKVPGNWTFVGVTDRTELDDQLYKNFASVGAVTEPEERVRADSAEHLKQLLSEDHRYVFTLIQKFRTERGQRFPKLSGRADIIVMTDEAHRTQYDIFAMNMRGALPKAAFIGFTGTPLIVGEEKTKEVFGDYVSIYDFKQSVDDGATVPLFYENRIPELQLTNEQLNDDIYRVIEESELDEDQQRKLERVLGQQYHLITRDDRLDRVAADIVEHFTGRGFKGKGMVVCIDKLTAVRMYDKVKAQWTKHEAKLNESMAKATQEEQDAILDTLNWMKTTDMAVVVSQAQNEAADFKAKGLDITPHRQRMVKEDLETKFKDPDDPFRLVFVCAMWMTGFDVPSCSTIYLDKPLRNHTLMQTIARANRVFGEKVNGLIVDYVGVFHHLQKALSIYAGGGAGGGIGGRTPVEAKQQLIAMLKKAIAEAVEFCAARGVKVDAVLVTSGLERVKALKDVRDAILVNDDSKRQFLGLAARTTVVYRAILPDTSASQFAPACALFATLVDMIRALLPPVDVSGVMNQIEGVLDKSIATAGYTITERAKPLDLSRIDFDALRKFFKKAHKRAEIERLRAAIAVKLHAMLAINRSRTDFLQKFQALIDEYNAGSANVEETYEQLLRLAQSLNDEEQRHVREQLSDEELTVFDILTKPAVDITPKERKAVKKVAQDMLHTLKAKRLVLDWRKRQQSRAAVRLCIEESLDKLPRAYTPDLYRAKCEAVYQHVYDTYAGGDAAGEW